MSIPSETRWEDVGAADLAAINDKIRRYELKHHLTTDAVLLMRDRDAMREHVGEHDYADWCSLAERRDYIYTCAGPIGREADELHEVAINIAPLHDRPEYVMGVW